MFEIQLIIFAVLFASVILSVNGKNERPSITNVTFEKSIWIPARVAPRSDLIPIANRYGIKNSCSRKDCGDFHLVLYYQSPHEALVLVRRLDASHWKFNFSIFIENMENRDPNHEMDYLHEIINIGPSTTFQDSKVIVTSLMLYPDPTIQQKQVIPKRIIQTYASRLPSNWYQWLARKTFEELNPEYELLMFNDIDCRQFLQQHFSTYRLPDTPTFSSSMTFLEAYDRLISTTFKADLFRYAFLVVYGGCYFDHKMIARKPLRSVIYPNDTLLLCSDALPDRGAAPLSLDTTQRLYNAIICTQPQDYRLWKTIDYIFYQIVTRQQSGSDLSLTGPMAFYEAIIKDLQDEQLRFSHGFYPPLSSRRRRRSYEDFYVKEKIHHEIFITKSYYDYDPGSPHLRYGKLWSKGLVYYDVLYKRLPWKLYVFPQQTKCVEAFIDEEDDTRGVIYLRAISFFPPEADLNLLKPCHLIRLVIIQDDTSEMWKLEIPFHDIVNFLPPMELEGGNFSVPYDHSDYRIPFLFS